MKINIIGDIHGRFDEFQLLLKKMPPADLILSVGDMVDRGPKSREVIEWFMNTPNTEALYGNHEDLMVKAVKMQIQSQLWFYNGGFATVKQFLDPDDANNILVPQEIIEWLENRPLYFETDGLFVSHAPVTTLKNIPATPHEKMQYHFVWNRFEPSKPQEKFLVNGHNTFHKKYKWGDGSVIGVCIDNSGGNEVMGMHWPTKEIFTQKYLPDPVVQLEETSDLKSEK